MINHLLFDFTVDKEAKTVYVTREFDAELPLVWDAFTKKEILDQWWAPEPFKSRTKYMNFEVGGKRFYAMVTPEGQERWAMHTYTSISPKTNYKMFNAFADADENLVLPGSDWDLSFSEQNARPDDPVGREITKVSISIHNDSLERMEKMIEMGFTEGFKATLGQLDHLLADLSKKK